MPNNEDRNPPEPGGDEVVPMPEVFAPVVQAPEPVPPEMIVTGMQHLQQRIPEFVQLSVREKQAKTRAAHLDPEFIRIGLQAAALWSRAEAILQRPVAEMQRDEEDARRWDDAIRSVSAILQGMTSGNLTRKARLGDDMLRLYAVLGSFMNTTDPEATSLRPYYEEMKRLNRKFAKAPKRKKKNDE